MTEGRGTLDRALTRSRIALAGLAAAGLLALAAPISTANAAKVKPGSYTCTYWTSFGPAYGGTLKILSGSEYKVNDGKKGKYTKRGKILNFKTGDYKKVYFGKRASRKSIELYDFKRGNYSMTCSR